MPDVGAHYPEVLWYVAIVEPMNKRQLEIGHFVLCPLLEANQYTSRVSSIILVRVRGHLY